MLVRNIDFLAVGLIALVMLGFSWVSSVRIDNVVGPIQLQNASLKSCPLEITNEVLSRIDYILNQ